MVSAVVQPIPLEKEYAKKTGITPQDIVKLRNWVSTQPHLPNEEITDLDLILAYHCCNRSAEVTKQVFDLNLTLRTLFVKYFKDRQYDDVLEKTLNLALVVPLKARAYDDSAVFYLRLLDNNAKNFVLYDCIRAVLMVLDLWQQEEGTWPGFMFVADMTGVTLAHLAKFDLNALREFFFYLQEAMLVNLKAIHFINAPSFMDKVMMLLRPLMKKKLLESVYIHQCESKTLEKYVPMSGLPKEAGGDYLPLNELRDNNIARMKANNDWFLKENSKRVNETKRPGKPKTITDIFGGIEGSFKKLDID